MPRERTVYMLGAGCSKSAGFPLGSTFKQGLANFGEELGVRRGCARLKWAVDDSINELRNSKDPSRPYETIDAYLMAKAKEEAESLPLTGGAGVNARIATSAMMMDLERNADLSRYDAFLDRLFGSERDWQEASVGDEIAVLSFNYDRLFELAFLKWKFGPNLLGAPEDLYLPKWLNSALTEEVASDRFSFLKLHGSAGITFEGSDSTIWKPQLEPFGDGSQSCREERDRYYFKGPSNLVPLIVFPHDHTARSYVYRVSMGGTTHEVKRQPTSFERYRDRVWNHAKHLINRADNLVVIGFSFSEPVREFALKLLGRPEPLRIVVEDPDPESTVSDLLRKKFPQHSCEWECKPF